MEGRVDQVAMRLELDRKSVTASTIATLRFSNTTFTGNPSRRSGTLLSKDGRRLLSLFTVR